MPFFFFICVGATESPEFVTGYKFSTFALICLFRQQNLKSTKFKVRTLRIIETFKHEMRKDGKFLQKIFNTIYFWKNLAVLPDDSRIM